MNKMDLLSGNVGKRIIIFDTETTGLSAPVDIVQLGAVVCDEKFNIIQCINQRFKYDESLLALKDKLDTPPQGEIHFIEWFKANEEWWRQGNTLWCAYNTKFDCDRIDEILTRYGMPKMKWGRKATKYLKDEDVYSICLMSAVKRYSGLPHAVPLAAACNEWIPEDAVDEYDKLASELGLEYNPMYHDGFYDAYHTYRLMKYNRAWFN